MSSIPSVTTACTPSSPTHRRGELREIEAHVERVFAIEIGQGLAADWDNPGGGGCIKTASKQRLAKLSGAKWYSIHDNPLTMTAGAEGKFGEKQISKTLKKLRECRSFLCAARLQTQVNEKRLQAFFQRQAMPCLDNQSDERTCLNDNQYERCCCWQHPAISRVFHCTPQPNLWPVLSSGKQDWPAPADDAAGLAQGSGLRLR